MNNETGNNLIELEKEHDNLWAEMLDNQKKSDQPERREDQGKKFESLPDGKYVGRVFITASTVANGQSANYGRKKYEFELVVIEGDHKGKTAYHHRVLLPSSMGTRPAESDAAALNEYRAKTTKYFQKTKEMLEICGVNTNEKDSEQLVRNIAQANNRRPIVNFSMNNGTTYLNHLLRKEMAADELGLSGTIPDGSDAPLD